MPLLVETIRADDGRFDSLEPHILRMARCRRALFGEEAPLNLEGALKGASSATGAGRWKVRVLYDTEIRRVEASLYNPKQYRSAALVEGGAVSYSCKTVERPELDALTRRAESLGTDTALIVRNGQITDFSYANAAFFDGEFWWTPSEPLLQGTRRARLLAGEKIREARITPADLDCYIYVSPINAMLELGEVIMNTAFIRRDFS